MTEANAPLVSILIPVHDAEATLAATLRSALASSYRNLEIVLVDDGSIDASAKIAEEFMGSDARVRVLRRAHCGVSATLNFGLAQVRGSIVARMDSDDLWHPTKLAKQVGLLAANPSTALVCTFVRYVDGEGRIVRDATPQSLSGRALCQCLYDGIIGGGSSAVFRRSVLDSAGGYDEGLSVWEDLLLYLKIAATGEITFVPEYLTGYRLREKSSSSDRLLSLESWRAARQRIEQEFPQIPPFVHEWSSARRLLELAEGFAIDGRFAAGAKLIAECLARDPVRTSTFLAYRMHRRLGGKRYPPHRRGPLFADADVTTNYCLSDFDAGLEGKRLRSLDDAREQILRSIDRKIPASPHPRPKDVRGKNPSAEPVP